MPIYEYQCRKCRRVTERIQAISDPPPGKCPSCGGTLKRLMSSGAFILKGTGWYATDYARKGNGAGGTADRPKGKEAAGGKSCPAQGGSAGACDGCPKKTAS